MLRYLFEEDQELYTIRFGLSGLRWTHASWWYTGVSSYGGTYLYQHYEMFEHPWGMAVITAYTHTYTHILSLSLSLSL